jgi:hypothetical protein
MVSKDDEADDSIQINDSVVMGNININPQTNQFKSEQSILPILRIEGEREKYIQSHWLDYLQKHTSENIPIEDHSIVVDSVFTQVFCLSSDYKDRVEISLALEIYNILMLDSRIQASPTMQSELSLLSATISSKKTDFMACKSSLNTARVVLATSEDVDAQPTLGIFEKISHWWDNEGQNRIDTIDELSADLIGHLCESKSFLKEHGGWILQICEQNISGSAWPEMFRFVKLDRYFEETSTVMFESILENNSFSLEQFEHFSRLMFHKNTGYFLGPKMGFEGEYERDNFLQLSVKSIQSKMFDIFPTLNAANNEKNITEFWSWFELLAFISTVKLSEFENITLRQAKSNTNHDIFGALSKFFSELEELATTQNNDDLKEAFAKVDGLAIRVFGAINALNAAYCGGVINRIRIVFWGQFNTIFHLWFDFRETDFEISWKYSRFGTNFSMSPEFMPRWWSGNIFMAANPDFETTYAKWKNGMKISDIEPPSWDVPPSL